MHSGYSISLHTFNFGKEDSNARRRGGKGWENVISCESKNPIPLHYLPKIMQENERSTFWFNQIECKKSDLTFRRLSCFFLLSALVLLSQQTRRRISPYSRRVYEKQLSKRNITDYRRINKHIVKLCACQINRNKRDVIFCAFLFFFPLLPIFPTLRCTRFSTICSHRQTNTGKWHSEIQVC